MGFLQNQLHLWLQSSGCIGSPLKSELISSVDTTVKQEYPDAPAAPKELNLGLSESVWTPSTCDMDNSTVQSVGSISSISNSTQMYDTHGIGNSNANAEFVNQGLLLWNQTRDKWIDSRKPQTPAVQHSREPKLRTLLRYDVVNRILRELCWSATYDCLFESNKPFPKPVPLAELVDFLVDVWENEGMYD